MGPPAQGRKRRQKDRNLRRLRYFLQDRGRGAARQRLRRQLQSRSMDGAEGAAQGRRFHRVRHVRGAPSARRRRLASAQQRRTEFDRRADRFRHRRRRTHRRQRHRAARERPAPDFAVLRAGQHHQSGVGVRVDRIRPQGPQSCGGHRLLDRRACHRRCGAHGGAGRCRCDGGGRHRIAGQSHCARRLRGVARTFHRFQRRAQARLAPLRQGRATAL